MNDTQRQQIRQLREEGKSYAGIASLLGLSENTIKTFCKRNGLGGVMAVTGASAGNEHFCQNCGKPVIQTVGRKEKRFCSSYCRNKWWNTHLDQVNRKANYEFECPTCHKTFTAYGNKHRKYCCHACYIQDRFGGGCDDERAV